MTKADAKLKNKGLLLQLAGVIVLVASLYGFFVLQGTPLYFIGVIVGVIVFAVCLFRGSALVKQSKKQKS